MSIRSIFITLIIQFYSYSCLAESDVSSSLDPEADRLLKQAFDYLKSADSFSLRSEISYDEVLPSGRKVIVSRGGEILLDRPNRFFVKMDNQDTGTRIYYSDSKMTIYDELNHFYTQVELPGTIDDALDEAREKFDFRAPLADLMVSDPYANIIERIDIGYYLGFNYYEGDYYHQLLLSNDAVDAQLWIADGDQPYIRSITITYKQLPAAPQFRAELSNWKINPTIKSGAFNFKPPEDAVRIDSLPISYSVQ